MVCAALLSVTACTDPPNAFSPGVSHGRLTPGQPHEVDLDADGDFEQVEIDPDDDSLTVSDGAVFYRSRAKWQVVEAVLGDTDGDGLTEVITLLDSTEGRHIGLFAFFGGSYRERLVTQAIVPAPVTLEVVPGDTDLLALTQPSTSPKDAPIRILLRWNGFGYTRIDMSSESSP